MPLAITWREPRVAFALAVCALLAAGLVQRICLVEASLPYPRHVDERHVANAARKVLESGSFKPKRLDYPSLPTYLAAAGMAAGYLQWAAQPEAKLKKRKRVKVGRVKHPFYANVRAMRAPRILFATLSMLAVLLAIAAARRLGAGRIASLVAGALLTVAPHFMQSSWEYLNVDIVGTFFGAALLYAMTRYWHTDAPFRVAAWLGILVGLAAGSKYTNGVQLLSVGVFLAVRHPGRALPLFGTATASAAAAFVAVVPHALLSLPLLLRSLAYQAHHYAAKGHTGHNVAPGLSHLATNLMDLAENFGWATPVLVTLGVFALARTRWPMACVAAALLLIPLVFLSRQRVHFVRNVLPVFPAYAATLAVGLQHTLDLVTAKLPDLRPTLPARPIAWCLLAILVIAPLPWRDLARRHDPHPESRARASTWLRHHGVKKAKGESRKRVLLDRDIPFDPHSLPGADVRKDKAKKLFADARPGDYLILAGHTPKLPAHIKPLIKLGRSTPKRRTSPPNPKLTIAQAQRKE